MIASKYDDSINMQAMSMECAELAVGVASCLGPSVCKCLQYHSKLDEYVENLKHTRDELKGKMEDIERQLQARLHHPVEKIPKKEVVNWLKKGRAAIRKAQDVEDKISNGRYLCRAWNGKLADEKTQEMQNLLDKAPSASEALVVDVPSAGLPLLTSKLIGEKAVRDEIWECLMQEKVGKIGVWGMGGVGKTAIMMHIYNDLLEQGRFEKVIWVTLSRELDVVKLQDDIAGALNSKEDLAKEGDQLRRAAILSKMLKKEGKHVLILNDVWDEVSLKDVGIPEESISSGCKLVLTTRLKRVCMYLECKVIQVKPLSEKEARELFLNEVTTVPNGTSDTTLRHIVKECAGLPHTIVVVAGNLKGQNEPRVWKNALEELKERIGNVEEVEAKVIKGLKFSYDHLKDEKVKLCFLYCAFYPEDFAIEKDELIECWINEGFINKMATREKMKDKGHDILKRLEDNCLLENVAYDQPRVKMHDALRDMALSVTSKNHRYMIQAGLQLKKLPNKEKWTTDIKKVSLMNNNISEIPIDVSPPKCPSLTTVLLQNNPIERIPHSFFADMPRLRVLNLSSTRIECLPNSITELTSLTALLLCRCEFLRRLPCLSKLQGLKKLELCRTGISEVPEGMDMLMNLTYLDLHFCKFELTVGVLQKLSGLQHLRCNLLTSLKSGDVVPLEELEFFCGRFEDVGEWNKFVLSMQQSKKNLKYELHVGSCRALDLHSGVHFQRENAVWIDELKLDAGKSIELPTDIQELRIESTGIESLLSFSFQSLKKLSISGCTSMKTLLPHMLLPDLQNLEEIEAYNCDELAEILGRLTLEGKGNDALIKFNLPKLIELRLQSLPQLESICGQNGAMVCDSLQCISVKNCSKLKKIPPFVPLVGNAQPYAYAPRNLEIKSSRGWWESLEWDDPNFENVLQRHCRLNPHQKDFVQTEKPVWIIDQLQLAKGKLIILPKDIQELRIQSTLVESLFIESIFSFSSFHRLKGLSILGCTSMKTLIPHRLLPDLKNLEEIKVSECDELAEILGMPAIKEERSDALIEFNLPKLIVLRLQSLPKLESICSHNGAMVCDSLRCIEVYNCSKLKRIPRFVPLDVNAEPYAYVPHNLQIRSSTEWRKSLEWDDPNLYVPHNLQIRSSTEWWKSLEWDDLNFENVLQRHCRLNPHQQDFVQTEKSVWIIDQLKLTKGKLIIFPEDIQELRIQSTLVESLFIESIFSFSSFHRLKRLSILGCTSMKTLIPHRLLPDLKNLEEIKVSKCDELAEILGMPAMKEERSDALIEFNLPKLIVLRLQSLPKLESICSHNGAMVCDSLRCIEVYNCSKLKRIPPFVPLDVNAEPYAYVPHNLQITSSTGWWESLKWDDPHFESILQLRCQLKPFWQDFVQREKPVWIIDQLKLTKGKLIVLPEDIQELRIQSTLVESLFIESILSFSSFHRLKRLSILGCTSMKTLIPHRLLPDLKNLEEIKVSKCDELAEILGMPTLGKKRSDALIKFNLPKLIELRLHSLPQLESICGPSGAMVCDSLKRLEVYNCSKLKRIPSFVPLISIAPTNAYAPADLQITSSRGWWESLDWGHDSKFQDVLQHRCKLKPFWQDFVQSTPPGAEPVVGRNGGMA